MANLKNTTAIPTTMTVMREALAALSQDKELTAEVEKYLDHKDAVELGSLGTAVRFMADLGATLADMPELGSTPEDVKGTNRPSDKYETTVVVDGEHKNVTRSRWRELFEAHPIGAAILKRKALIAAAKEGDEINGVRIGSPQERKALEATEAKHMTNWVGMGNRAVEICQQIGRLQRFSNVSLRVFSTPKKPDAGKPSFRFPQSDDIPEGLWKPGEYLVNTPRPIMLRDVVITQGKDGRERVAYENETAMSVGQFLGLNPDGKIVKDKDGNVDTSKSIPALPDNATKADLVNSNKRGTKATTVQPGQTAPRIESDAQWFTAAMESYAYVDVNTEDGLRRLNRLFATKDDSLFVMLCDYAEALASRLKGDVSKRYDKIMDKQAAAQSSVETKTA